MNQNVPDRTAILKPHITVTFIGHESAGKSTLIGRILHELHLSTLSDEHDLRKDLRVRGEEHQTLSLSRRTIELNYTMCHLVDTPGHFGYLKNLATGVGLSDVIVIVVASTAGDDQLNALKEIIIVMLHLVKRPHSVMVAYNQIQDFNEEHYKRCEEKLALHLDQLKPSPVRMLRLSAILGEALIAREETEGQESIKPRNIIQELGNISAPERDIEGPLRICIHTVHKVSGFGTVLLGIIHRGTVKVGMRLRLAPFDVVAKALSLEVNLQTVQHATAGAVVGIHIRDLPTQEKKWGPRPIKLRRGIVASDEDNSPLLPCDKFVAKIQVIKLPWAEGVDKKKHPKCIKPGYVFTMQVHFETVECRFVRLVRKTWTRKGKGQIVGEQQHVLSGQLDLHDMAEVVLQPLRPACLEKYNALQRFTLWQQTSFKVNPCVIAQGIFNGPHVGD